jgi:hypothetical protein
MACECLSNIVTCGPFGELPTANLLDGMASLNMMFDDGLLQFSTRIKIPPYARAPRWVICVETLNLLSPD